MRSNPRRIAITDTSDPGMLPALIAHELRTPLSTLSCAAQVLLTQVGDDPAGFAALEMIRRQVRVMSRIVDDLLSGARKESSDFPMQRVPGDLRDAIQHAVRACEPAFRERGHALEVRGLERPLPVTADFDRLVQVFVNLLDNAIKYTPEGGRIRIQAAVECEKIVVRIADTGAGMSAAALPHVFELFHQDPSTLAMSNGGAGIGLALVQRFVALHGGTVEARSEGAGKGSELVVRLPLDAPRTAAEPTEPPRRSVRPEICAEHV